MSKIKIITVSTADLPQNIIEKYDIEVLPLIVNVGEKSYLDGVEIKTQEFLRIMEESDVLPTTSQVNPQRYYDCFKKYLEEGYQILVLNMSSKMSGTYQSACIAKDMLENDNIVIIDTLNVTSGLGVLVLKACKLREQGLSLKEIGKEIIATIPHVKSSLVFNRLDNLVKGGRISKTAGAIGNLLGIKLILAVKDGEMVVTDKVRGTKKAVRTVIDYIDETGIDENETCILLNVEEEEIRQSLYDNLVNENKKFIECEVGCVVATHSGPNACGIFFIEKY